MPTIEGLIKKRTVVRRQATKLVNECEAALGGTLAPEAVRVFESRLSDVKFQLNAVDNEIEEQAQEESELEQTLQYNDKLVTCLAKLAHRRESSTNRPTGGPVTSHHPPKARLPKLELAKFNGQRNMWQQFWELFELVVHQNDDLTEVDKFNYLKGCLTGDAAAAIRGLPPTARCYNDAVDLLKQRFGDEELLVQSHMTRLIDLHPVRTSQDTKGLRRLYDHVMAHVRGLESLGKKQESFDSLLFPVLQRALPRDLLLDFNKWVANEQRIQGISRETEQQGDGDQPLERVVITSSFSHLLDFLKREVQSRESLEFVQATSGKPAEHDGRSGSKKSNRDKNARRLQSTAALLQQPASGGICFFCDNVKHDTTECDVGTSLDTKKKRLSSVGRCFRCTKPNHRAKECHSNVKCKRCTGRHATTMCDPSFIRKDENSTTVPQNPAPEATTSAPVNLECNSEQRGPTILLPTAMVWCCGEDQRDRVRALLDSGSQRSFIRTEVARKLGCKEVGREKLTVGAFGGHQTEKVFPRVLVRLEINDGRLQDIEALEIETICNQVIPRPSTVIGDKLAPLSCPMADPADEETAASIGLLVGCEHYWIVTTGRSRKLDGKLRAIETVFGWALQGPVPGSRQEGQYAQAVALTAAVYAQNTADVVAKFWTLESIGIDDTRDGRRPGLDIFRTDHKTRRRALRDSFTVEDTSRPTKQQRNRHETTSTADKKVEENSRSTGSI